ncbi:MAG TPA: hypothetical protein VMA36_06725 [Candidatus Limnocylindria bacterium]|jgi:hypothetical protein|nr:hypothetical protein [Candidatus Limnocylindria bacterium]
MNDDRSLHELLEDVRRRVERRTFLPDLVAPGTGVFDYRRIAAKLNNLEHAVDELAAAVARVADGEERRSA